MNTGIVVVLLSLGVVCVVLGLLLLSLRRDNARLSDERAAADEARRLAEESRRVSEEKAAAAEIEIRTLVERSTLAQARLEAAEQNGRGTCRTRKNGGNFPDPVQEPRQ